jgi:hypothetical protein
VFECVRACMCVCIYIYIYIYVVGHSLCVPHYGTFCIPHVRVSFVLIRRQFKFTLNMHKIVLLLSSLLLLLLLQLLLLLLLQIIYKIFLFECLPKQKTVRSKSEKN